VDWIDVEQVILLKPTIPACPICLQVAPVAPKVTKCGHVYCYPCILHYLSLGEKKWRKCPICYDAIYANALKSARLQIVRDYSKLSSDKDAGVVNDPSTAVNRSENIVMKLMQRSSVCRYLFSSGKWKEADVACTGFNKCFASTIMACVGIDQTAVLRILAVALADLLQDCCSQHAVY
jgi:hypothetical protein